MRLHDKRKYGITDMPVGTKGEDEFHIKPYVEALGEFIMECDSPMTIAVQGDWGSGKSSMLQMLQDHLDENVVTMWFNTWQFSQFNMGDELSIIFLKNIVESLSQSVENKNATKIVNTIFEFTKRASVAVASAFINESVGSEIEKLIDKNSDDVVSAILQLRNEFQELINLNQDRQGRVVIFIDDLDRLQPVRAVELLEVLKLFLDCKGCIFVLAIDTEVVYKGIRKKYGEDIDDLKAKSFFEKIIQLPFRVPVESYKMDNYIRNLIGIIGDEDSEDIKTYCRLIEITSERNPRSIKRIANAFALLNKVAEKKKGYSDNPRIKKASQKVLLVLMCIQMKYERVYQYLYEKADVIENIITVKISTASKKDFGFIQKFLLEAKETAVDYSIEQQENLGEILLIFKKWCKELAQISNKDGLDYSIIESIITLSTVTSNEDRMDKKRDILDNMGICGTDVGDLVGYCINDFINDTRLAIEKTSASTWITIKKTDMIESRNIFSINSWRNQISFMIYFEPFKSRFDESEYMPIYKNIDEHMTVMEEMIREYEDPSVISKQKDLLQVAIGNRCLKVRNEIIDIYDSEKVRTNNAILVDLTIQNEKDFDLMRQYIKEYVNLRIKHEKVGALFKQNITDDYRKKRYKMQRKTENEEVPEDIKYVQRLHLTSLKDVHKETIADEDTDSVIGLRSFSKLSKL